MQKIVVFVAYELVLAAILFGCADRLDLPWFWALIGCQVGLSCLALGNVSSDLFQERLRPAPGGENRQLRWRAVPLLLGQLIIAGLDAGRFQWSGTLSPAVHLAGLAAYIAGLALALESMVVNQFFSPVVRVQEERGHHLVTNGPYRFVRHPGYAGMLLAFLGLGPALGSWWALLPSIPLAFLIIHRARLEDRYLHAHLAGYPEYADRVRYRVLPGGW